MMVRPLIVAAVLLMSAPAHAFDTTSLAPGDARRVEAVLRARTKPEVTGKIVGGTVAGETPWAVAFAFRKPDNSLFQYCGGTLIDKHWVLTAAHCDVRVGDTAIVGRRILSTTAGKEIDVKQVVPHAAYDAPTSENDIALVALAEDSPTASLPLLSSDASLPSQLKVLGWGLLREKGAASDVLQEVSVPVVSEAKCKDDYSKAQIAIKQGMVCAGEEGKDSCQGDSGGPLVEPDGKHLVGIVSFGVGCARPEFPGVYTSVKFFRPWIKEKAGL